jgi:hypothetical protein
MRCGNRGHRFILHNVKLSPEPPVSVRLTVAFRFAVTVKVSLLVRPLTVTVSAFDASTATFVPVPAPNAVTVKVPTLAPDATALALVAAMSITVADPPRIPVFTLRVLAPTTLVSANPVDA